MSAAALDAIAWALGGAVVLGSLLLAKAMADEMRAESDRRQGDAS